MNRNCNLIDYSRCLSAAPGLRRSQAIKFTLIELLIVIAIITIRASSIF